MPTPTYTRLPEGDAAALARVEWLLTNGIGGFSMGSALSAMSRRYHGLLIASLRPPVQRIMALNSLAESVLIEPAAGDRERRAQLSKYCFRPGELHPRGDSPLVSFQKDASVRWEYQARDADGRAITIRKHLAMVRGANTIIIRYTILGDNQPVRLVIRPLVSLRDYHALILRDTSGDRFRVENLPDRFAVQSPSGTLHIAAAGAATQRDEQWWFNFQYDHERERGYDYLEDLFTPGQFAADLQASSAGATITLVASTDPITPAMLKTDPESIRKERIAGWDADVARLPAAAKAAPWASALIAAADDFVVKRLTPGAPPTSPLDRVSVVAGYPWFADWGRDSMISLPGLLLTTGRLAEALAVLRTFAGACKGGLVPNVFDDYTGEAHYNTADASLWFLHACCEYLRVGGDAASFKTDLLPACKDIIEHYISGADGGIRMDPVDGLIIAGNETTQLTWMDAKRDGVVFTPRFGKAVEINALWYHALRSLEAAAAKLDPALAKRCAEIAGLAGPSIASKFWNQAAGCLFDLLTQHGAEWHGQPEIRPNQLVAVSLRHSALDAPQKKSIVAVCKRLLVTPLGVRTLDPSDPRYRGRFRGRIFDRDAAYHNGTAWPWLLGPLAEAVLRAGNFSAAACIEAEALLAPSIAYLNGPCLGQLPEVLDGDDSPNEPQQPGGCPAQAWSVAEVLRTSTLCARARRGETNL